MSSTREENYRDEAAKRVLKVGIIGDYDPRIKTHNATNAALDHAAKAASVQIDAKWVSTVSLVDRPDTLLSKFDALWAAPGSPYQSFEGAINGIKFARENDVPFLGTCGGFQHAVIEYARNVLGMKDADHEESNPNATTLLMTRLACSPFGQTMGVQLELGSACRASYQKDTIEETYYCNFGLNPAYRDKILQSSELKIAGVDEQGEVRILELPRKRFFVLTLFVPQLSSLPEKPSPLIVSYLRAARKFEKPTC